MNGTEVEATRPEKVLWPEVGITKRRYVAYLAAVGDRMLTWLRDRPLTLVRAPDGIEGDRYFQKAVSSYAPAWVRTVRVPAPSARRDIDYVVCNDGATLAWLGNQAAVEFHPAPVRADRLDRPDLLVMDIDPPAGAFDAGVEVAGLVLEVPDDLRLPFGVKTTGGKGLHIVAPIERRVPPIGATGRRRPAHRARRRPAAGSRHRRVPQGRPRRPRDDRPLPQRDRGDDRRAVLAASPPGSHGVVPRPRRAPRRGAAGGLHAGERRRADRLRRAPALARPGARAGAPPQEAVGPMSADDVTGPWPACSGTPRSAPRIVEHADARGWRDCRWNGCFPGTPTARSTRAAATTRVNTSTRSKPRCEPAADVGAPLEPSRVSRAAGTDSADLGTPKATRCPSRLRHGRSRSRSHLGHSLVCMDRGFGLAPVGKGSPEFDESSYSSTDYRDRVGTYYGPMY